MSTEHPLGLHLKPQPRQLTLEDLKHMRKAELHCHLDGSLRPRTVIDLAYEQDVKLKTYDEKELTNILTVPEDCPSLEVYLEPFAITGLVLQYPYALTRSVYEICEDAYHDGISYIEIRFAPILHTAKNCTLSEVVHAAIEGVNMAEKAFPITCRLIVCVMRQLSPPDSLNAAEIAYRYRHSGVVALDAAGPESGFPPENHKEAFALARTKGLNVTIHAGEAAGPESIDHAIRICGAQRLGHGVALRESPSLLETVVNSGIAVESCPTSNLQTKAVKSLDEHPIKDFFNKGVVVVPCTDNVTVSGVSLSGEYLQLHLRKGFAVEELVRMMDYGFKAAFIPVGLKTRIRLSAMQETLTYLHSQNFDISGLLEDLPLYDPIFYGIQPHQNSPMLYWERRLNPSITKEIVRALPKVDLHVRLVGGMSLHSLWEESQKSQTKLTKEFQTEAELEQAFHQIVHSNSDQALLEHHLKKQKFLTVDQAREYMLAVLQTKEQLLRCMDDIYRLSKEDGIVYFELMVRPKDHTEKDLSEEDVVNVLIEGKAKFEQQYNIRSSIFLSCRVPDDDPLQFKTIAELIFQNRDKGIIGFSTFGDDLTKHDTQFFLKAFWFMKKHNIPVIISSARTSASNIIPAISECGAVRISGANTLHDAPNIVKYMSDHRIPVDLSVTHHMKVHSRHIEKFASNAFRFLIDNDIRVLPCSIARNLELFPSLVDTIMSVVEDCNIRIHELVDILSHAFRCTALPFLEREKMYRQCVATTTDILTKNGFHTIWKKAFLPEHTIPFPEPHPLAPKSE